MFIFTSEWLDINEDRQQQHIESMTLFQAYIIIMVYML